MAERQAGPQSGPSPDGLIVQLRALVLHRCELGSGFWSDQMLGEQPESGDGIGSGFCIGACDIGAQFSEQIEFERYAFGSQFDEPLAAVAIPNPRVK